MFFFFFFFQAEDGIRDLTVTGVQTCALPISHWRWHPLAGLSALYEFLSSNETYRKMISLKNRVVRLTYADEFYMDILPAYTDLSSGGTFILVPDRARVSLCPSNPEGFILMLRNRWPTRTRRVMEKAKPVPAQEAVHEKEPLQLAVQLLKRWRDLAFAEEIGRASCRERV